MLSTTTNFAQRCDVVVIGGGPGGSLAATYLARKGYDVVLYEKQKHPRYAVGESLIPDFWKYCDRAGVSERLVAEKFVQKAGGVVEWRGKRQLVSFGEFAYDRPALHVERDCFDAILLDNAREKGVRVIENAAVVSTDVGEDGGSVSVRATESDLTATTACRIVVDASGQSAALGRQLGLRRIDESFRFMSIWGYFRDARYIAPDGQTYATDDLYRTPPSTFVTSLAQTGHQGWSWHIALRNRTSVGFILPIDYLKRIKREGVTWRACFLKLCRDSSGLNTLLDEAAYLPGSVRLVRDYSYRTTRVAGPGYFLVGDAAGFVDPLFSIGAVLAMYGAYAAAWAIDRTLRAPQRSTHFRYQFEQQLQGRIELARSLALPLYQNDPVVTSNAVNALRLTSDQAQRLIERAAELTERSQNYRALRNAASLGKT